ncbi:MAG: hypothetical protein L3J13_10140, partial [Devosiaceae bacterium]|nr:hypothetical protein [Devosiaceae bacterium]
NQTSQTTDEVRTVGEGDAPKNTTKLTPDGETLEVKPVEPATDEQQSSTNADTQVANDAQTTATPDEVTPQVTEVDETGQQKPEDVQAAQNTATDAQTTGQNVAPLVAQKAFLYEEGNSGTNASRDNAAIIWSLGEEAGEGGVVETVIKGKLDVPGRDLSMSLVIKQNRDDSLPASHIIELAFNTPNDFSGGNISSVTRFVMKSSEQARGEGLVAVPAKISDGNFLIALNNLEQALATNRKLLLESSWIDVLIGYSTGRRALVTLEKGALGNKVFRDAFDVWEKH